MERKSGPRAEGGGRREGGGRASVTQGDVGVANLARESWGKEAGANVMSHVILKHKPIATKYIVKDFSLAANKETKPAGLFMRDKGVFMNFLPPPPTPPPLRFLSLFHSLGRFLSRERQENVWRPRARTHTQHTHTNTTGSRTHHCQKAIDLHDHTNLLSHISILNTSGGGGEFFDNQQARSSSGC
jgi:hypothetical protein